jgi:hypothetical protein
MVSFRAFLARCVFDNACDSALVLENRQSGFPSGKNRKTPEKNEMKNRQGKFFL